MLRGNAQPFFSVGYFMIRRFHAATSVNLSICHSIAISCHFLYAYVFLSICSLPEALAPDGKRSV
jgi:hypothetical protein